MRGLPLLVIADHQPSDRPPVPLRTGQRVRAGRYDRDPDGWPAFRLCTTPDGAEGWVPDRFLDAVCDRRVDVDEDATLLADYDTTELAVQAGETVRSLDEDGLWVRCTADDGGTGWVPLASCSFDGRTPAIPRGPVRYDDIPPQLYSGEWWDGAPAVESPESDGTGHRGFPLRDTPGLTIADYRASPTGKSRHELHRGTFVFPGREPLWLNALRSRLGVALFTWTEEHGGRSGISGPSSRLRDDTVVWPWLAVAAAGREDLEGRLLEGPPELAVEVLDPGLDDPYLDDRLALLTEHGTPEVWLLQPRTGGVEVRTAAGVEHVDADRPLRSAALAGLVVDPVHRRPR